MKNISLLIFIILISFLGISQTKEEYCDIWRNDTNQNISIALKRSKEALDKVDKKCKVEILIQCGRIYDNQRKIDSSFYYFNEAIAISKSISNTELLASAMSYKAKLYLENDNEEKGINTLKDVRDLLKQGPNEKAWKSYYFIQYGFFRDKGEYYKSLAYQDSIYSIVKKQKDTLAIASVYHNKAGLYIELSDYDEASINLMESVRLRELQETPVGLDRAYNSLASCYVNLEQFELAKKYLEKSLVISKQLEDDYLTLVNQLDLAYCTRKLEQYKYTLTITDSALALAKKMKLNHGIARVYKEKGSVYLHHYKDYDKAEEYFLKSYEFIKSKNNSTKSASLNGLVKVYLEKKEYKNAQKYLTIYDTTVKKRNSLSATSTLYESYSNYYEKTGQFALAVKYLKEYHKINDSISNKDIETKIINLEKKYDTKNKELQITNLNQEKIAQEKLTQEANFKRNIYLASALLLLSFLLAGIWTYSKLKKQKQKLTITHNKLSETNNVKNRLFSIIAHDLRGMIIPFQRTGKIVKFHIDNNNQKRAVEIAQSLEKNSESLSNMLDNLLNWSLDQMNGYTYNPVSISLKNELLEITNSFAQHADYKKTIIELNPDNDITLLFDKGALHVIFRNLISNALKFTENGKINISFKQEAQTLKCTVEDTGIGMTEEQVKTAFDLENYQTTEGTQGEKGTGLGLNLVYRFVKMQKGDITVSSKEGLGSRFDLSFPILES